jgi:hypothetical protein
LLENFSCAPQSPAAAKAGTKKEGAYRSGEPVRHPKTKHRIEFFSKLQSR